MTISGCGHLNEPLTASVTHVCNGARSSRNIVITSSPSGNWSISNSITYKGSDGWALNGNINNNNNKTHPNINKPRLCL